MREYLASVADVLRECGSDETNGLGDGVAEERLAQDGPNKLKEAEKVPLWVRFFQQMADPMVIMLIIAAVISAVTGVIQGEADFADVVIIMFVVILNSVLGVVQEAKSEEALEALQEMASATSKVVRGGRQIQVPSHDLVVGDLVILEAGDSVPADCRILESASMKVEEAALTGESVPVTKHASTIELAPGADDVPLGDRKNMCYMGSTVVFGRGRAVVVATGMNTEMGKIADAISTAQDEKTPLQVKLDELSRILTILVVVICAVVFLTGFLRHGSAFLASPNLVIDTFMVAVALAVAAIPEGLVAVVTIVLSMGVTKMSERHAIIRKLSAVETLGCTQVICSDKTGTLTQNKMTVVDHVTGNLTAHVRTMALASDAKWDAAAGVAVGEPTEAALVADAARLGFTTDHLTKTRPRVGEAPFDSSRKMMSVVVRGRDGYTQHTKGGPDVVLARCTRCLTESDGVVPMTDELRARIMVQNKAMSDRALRVLASARRDWGAEPPASFEADHLERDLTFVGLSGMIDPVRPEVKAAIEEARSAGIRVVMITGDHVDTAVAIARELDIIDSRTEAIMGSDLDRLTDAQLDAKVVDYGVYARVQPEHKTRIVDAWKRRGKVVGMTGDGVNDAPSIKRADIGIGMGITGTDVTKSVADMVLTDDNFATIVGAVEEGRRIYDDIRKCIQFLLSSNLAEVVSVFVASLVGVTVLLPTHLLWINLITDSLPALAMATEGAEQDIMKRKPRDAKDGIFAGGMGLDTIVQGVIIAVLTLVAYLIGVRSMGVTLAEVAANDQAGVMGMTMAFLTLSMVEMFHSLNMRSLRGSLFTLKGQNKWLWASLGVALLLTFVVIETPLSIAFNFAELDLEHYLISMGLAVLIIPIVEVQKAIMRAVDRSRG
ncbi:cation-translocating P-type ATPase [Olsenella sp. HMSC062G07]|uniref:cation-translocating P-type ATPase n=1 Tax=Olsenella sp. HMSC062G07 TaxID=1739330 RepID=UPI0008A5FBDE|nr:cation-translocating P-type ATPase [Olsenella sp. HMSC062G07]OFK23442.1 ATPase [Olsenella sp. HMSC062G07]